MGRNSLAAGCLATLLIGSSGTGAWAGDSPPPAPQLLDALDRRAVSGPLFDGAIVAGPWTFRPVAGVHASRVGVIGQPVDAGRSQEALTASLGFRGSATVDSRVGAIYSRLSLSFEHEFRANQHSVVSGASAARRTGYYGDRYEVDVMTADAMFAMRVSQSVLGFVEYGAEMDPGGAADHQVTFRLRFAF